VLNNIIEKDQKLSVSPASGANLKVSDTLSGKNGAQEVEFK